MFRQIDGWLVLALVVAIGSEPSRDVLAQDGLRDVKYYEVLKDLNKAHREALRQGRATVEVDYATASQGQGPLDVQVKILADITWSNQSVLIKFKADDPKMVLLGRPYDNLPLQDRPWEYILDTPNDCIVYNPVTKLAIIRRPGSDVIPPLLDLVPSERWTSCCPPLAIPGRPWSEIIGPSQVFPDSRFELELEGDGRLIRQVRTDPDGSRFEIIFSLEQLGNVVRSDFYPSNQREPTKSMRYTWEEPNGNYCALKTFKVKWTDPIDLEYQLRVTNLILENPVRQSTFSRSALFREFAEGTKIKDEVAGRTFIVGNEDPTPPMTERLDELAEEARSKGFTRPN